MKNPRTHDSIRREAVALLLVHKGGLSYAELSRKLHETMPSFSLASIATALHDLEFKMSTEVCKAPKGRYMHARFRDSETMGSASGTSSEGVVRVAESVFYETFADWLKNDAEVVTHAIPLGGNVFRDRWGTPDVIGKRESRRSDVIKVPTEIVAAEIKVDSLQLVIGFGQACAYRLFCHHSYLVIPNQTQGDELARLEALCDISGIALVTFDRLAPEAPAFKVRVRPKIHQPDISYTNRYLALIERQLFS